MVCFPVMPFKSTRHVYTPLAQQSPGSPLDDADSEERTEQVREDFEIEDTFPRRHQLSSREKWCSITAWTLKAVALALAAVLVFEMWDSVGYVEDRIDRYQATAERCTTPALRPSWRALGGEEKNQYVAAVKCLAKTPSAIHPGSSMYDDFTYIHIVHGNACRPFFTCSVTSYIADDQAQCTLPQGTYRGTVYTSIHGSRPFGGSVDTPGGCRTYSTGSSPLIIMLTALQVLGMGCRVRKHHQLLSLR